MIDGEPRFPMPPHRSGNGVAGGDFVVRFDLANRLHGDFNADNAVNHLDFAILNANFGKVNRL